MSKLDYCYDSQLAAPKIAKVTELVSSKYSSLNNSMSVHIDRLTEILDQLSAIEMTIEDSMVIGILVVSIEVQKLPVYTFIKMPTRGIK